MSQEITKPHELSRFGQLSPAQAAAVPLVVAGLSDVEIGEQVEVARETVCRWRNQDAEFIAAVNRERKAAWQASRHKVSRLVGKALDVIGDELDKGSVDAAWTLLRMYPGVFDGELPESLVTDPEEIRVRLCEEQAERESSTNMRLGFLALATKDVGLLQRLPSADAERFHNIMRRFHIVE